MGEKRSRAV
uniref:Uncharacterized protein n=1 Tax=Arundo donax TaxID=35708 RepID=A0A0A9BBE6_ARUDO